MTASQAPRQIRPTVRRDFAAGSTHIILEPPRAGRPAVDLQILVSDALLDAPLAVIVDVDALIARDVAAVGRLLGRTHDEQAFGAPLILVANPLAPSGRMADAMLSDRALICESMATANATAHALASTRRRAHAHLPATRDSPAAARRLVAAACQAWGFEHVADIGKVVASELVSNAVEHAGTDLDIGASVAGTRLRIGVRDRTPNPPRPAAALTAEAAESAALAERSRGLAIVQALVLEWGVLTCGDGKAVWATVEVSRGIRSGYPETGEAGSRPWGVR